VLPPGLASPAGAGAVGAGALGAGAVGVGTLVRVPLAGRSVRGWVVELDVPRAVELELRPVNERLSSGPAADVVDLARWAAWRWAGRLRPFLLAGSPLRRVRQLPPAGPPRQHVTLQVADPAARAAAEGLASGLSVLRVPPATGRLPLVEQVIAAAEGDVLVLLPTRADATRLADLLRRGGHAVALQPEDWPAAAAGGRVVVGTRGAAFAPVGRLAAALVLDAHSQSYVETRAPTWSASVVVAERCRRAGVPCLLVSPCPTLDLLAGAELSSLPRAVEREGWPAVEVLDRRGDDPRSGLYSSRLVTLAREAGGDPRRPVVLVLNRTGRARLLACRRCGELARCESCGAAIGQRERPEPGSGSAGVLQCPRCGSERPYLCASCGSTGLRVLRVGTGRAREELEALVGLPTAEVTAITRELPAAPVLVGTEAVLHRVRQAALVAFIDFDQELLAARMRASEQALALLAAAARLTGGRRGAGRLAVQTRLPDHEVIQAAVHGDPSRVSSVELERRSLLRLPPVTALAVLSGPDAAQLGAVLAGAGSEVEVAPLADGRMLVRAPGHGKLCAALAAAETGARDVRVEVDPLQL
jgi:primosomal protein N' (replication factor Y)